MTIDTNQDAKSCFEDLKNIWEGFSSDRIIPFCAPICHRPRAVIVGINHSVFKRGVTPENDHIAESLSAGIPTKNAFLREDYSQDGLSNFAEDMLGVLEVAGITPDENWMGTNRCPIQKTNLDEIRYLPSFEERQARTDKRLRLFFKSILPERIILVGKFAAALYYSKAESKTFDDMQPKIGELAKGSQTAILAVPYPNWPKNKEVAADRIERFW